MKRLFLLCLVSLCAFQASAQYYGHSGYGHGFNRTSSGEYLSAGYHGMVEFANGACFGGDFSTLFSTTHGYQFNQHIFLGAFWGLGLGCCGDEFITNYQNLLLENHMHTCLIENINNGNYEIVDEVVDLFKKFQ